MENGRDGAEKAQRAQRLGEDTDVGGGYLCRGNDLCVRKNNEMRIEEKKRWNKERDGTRKEMEGQLLLE